MKVEIRIEGVGEEETSDELAALADARRQQIAPQRTWACRICGSTRGAKRKSKGSWIILFFLLLFFTAPLSLVASFSFLAPMLSGFPIVSGLLLLGPCWGCVIFAVAMMPPIFYWGFFRGYVYVCRSCGAKIADAP